MPAGQETLRVPAAGAAGEPECFARIAPGARFVHIGIIGVGYQSHTIFTLYLNLHSIFPTQDPRVLSHALSVTHS